MRLILTGAGGWLAREISVQAQSLGFDTIGFSSSPDRCAESYDFADKAEAIEDFQYSKDDVLVHCAFSRKSEPEKLCKSLDYTRRVFLCSRKAGIRGVLNISSQAVYGARSVNASEESTLYPDYPYAIAKVASEELLKGILNATPLCKTSYTNIRLASLIGVSNCEAPRNVLYKFIENTLNGAPISIQGGDQKFSFLNIRDAASAILKLCNISPSKWKDAYNLGSGYQVSIIDMAKTVQSSVAKKCGEALLPIIIEDVKDYLAVDAGMNCTRLYSTLGWRPAISFEETINETVDYCIKQREG